jgi:hypothetical protein
MILLPCYTKTMRKAQPFERSSKNLPMFHIIFNNFIGGIAWAFGATVGISLLFALLTIIGKTINLVPIIGNFISQIIDFILAHNKNL